MERQTRGSRTVARAAKPFGSAQVAEVFASYPKAIRSRLMILRELIFYTAGTTEGVGELQETLKWGEPAYLTALTCHRRGRHA